MSEMVQFQLQEPDSSIQATLEQGSWIGNNTTTGFPNFNVILSPTNILI